MDSPMCLPFTYAVWSHSTILLKMFFIPEASAFEAILASIFISKICIQFLRIACP